MNKTGDYQIAQEISQQVFISFYKNMERISPELVKAWLIRCAQNAAIDYLRKTKHIQEVHLDEEAMEAMAAEEGNILVEESVKVYEEKRSNQELLGRILREVKTVNHHWFDILMLNCVEGLSYAEASERLKVPEQVLRARMYRARTYIREKFGDEYQDD
jgi:RNA polymerase sigma-70 factor (ECF subfamily)